MKFIEYVKLQEKIKEVAEKWFYPTGEPRTRSMSYQIVFEIMKQYDLDLTSSAKLFEKSRNFYGSKYSSDEYWKEINEIRQKFVGFTVEGYPILKS